MRVPLLSQPNNISLTIVHNSKVETVSLPMKPRIYIPSSTKHDGRVSNTIKKIPVGMKDTVELDVVEFNSIDKMNKFYVRYAHVVKMEYNELLYCEIPDFYYSYPNSDELKIMCLDIEVLTRGMGIFPNASRDPIIAIGYSMGDSVVTHSARCVDDERSIIDTFIDDVVRLDPDIIATYNGIKFDIPYILTRIEKLGIDAALLSRTNEHPTPTDIGGRIHWDMWIDVEGDQTLLGLPNRKLKTIGNHFGWSDIIDIGRDALSNTSLLVGTSELDEYLTSDIHLTEKLSSVYIGKHIAMSDMMGIPLRETINSYNSLIPKVMHARNLGDRYIGLYTNEERYSDLLGNMRYQSAKVAIYDDGEMLEKHEVLGKYFPKVYKIDFSSQYPTAMDTFNLSPDTTRIIDYREYSGEFDFKYRDNILWLKIPDKNIMKDIIIKIDMHDDGFLRKIIRTLGAKRKVLKEKSKLEPDNKSIYSQNWAIKVLMNSIYGYEGLTVSTHGDLSVAIATVGLCRWIVGKVEDMLGDTIIETDSVTGNTPICILRNDSYVDFIPISDLVPDYMYESINGRYKNIPTNIKVLTRNGWAKLNYVKQHLVEKDIYRVNTTDGYVEVTGDHSLFMRDGNEVKPSNISPGIELDIREIPHYAYRTDYSEDFAWLLGFIAAEGTVDINTTRGRYQLSIVNNDITTLQRCRNILASHYLLDCEIYDTRASSAVYKICKCNKAMVADLYNLCYTRRGCKKVPLGILNGTNNIKKAYLDGIWKGDGHIAITRKQHREDIDTVHHTLAAGIKYLINSTGTHTGILIRDDKPNVISIKKRIPRAKSRNVNEHIVKKVKILSNSSRWVYDISTEDGSFVTGIGGICCHNTDGIYISADPNLDNVNAMMSDVISDTFNLESRMGLELDEYADGYFYKTKNYILRELNGKIVTKGNTFKSSKHSRVYEHVVKESCKFILNNGNRDDTSYNNDKYKLVKSFKDWYNYKLTDYIKHIRLSNNPGEYSNQNCMQVHLARQAKEYLGEEIGKGDGLDYIVVKSGSEYTYRLASLVNSLNEIYFQYYDDEIGTALGALGFTDNDMSGQMELL